jgi:sulfur relay protein TusB/DsrH
LLIEDGVCAAERNNSRPLFALNDDLDDREMVKPGKNVEVVDYEGFVDLVTRHQPIISWR